MNARYNDVRYYLLSSIKGTNRIIRLLRNPCSISIYIDVYFNFIGYPIRPANDPFVLSSSKRNAPIVIADILSALIQLKKRL